MYYVIKRTWRAGADPTGAPDLEKTVASAATQAAATARAEALAKSGKVVQFDRERNAWRAKAADAMHEFQVSAAGHGRRR